MSSVYVGLINSYAGDKYLIYRTNCYVKSVDMYCGMKQSFTRKMSIPTFFAIWAQTWVKKWGVTTNTSTDFQKICYIYVLPSWFWRCWFLKPTSTYSRWLIESPNLGNVSHKQGEVTANLWADAHTFSGRSSLKMIFAAIMTYLCQKVGSIE